VLTIQPVTSPSGVGHGVRIESGVAGGTDAKGGALVLVTGAGNGTGLFGDISMLAGGTDTLVKVMSKDATHHALALCGNPVPGNLPSGITSYIYVGDLTGTLGSDPVGGHLYGSVGGNPWWITSSGNMLVFEGSTHGTDPNTPPGAFFNWVGFKINSTDVVLPAYLR
jgi:hypothetical protein